MHNVCYLMENTLCDDFNSQKANRARIEGISPFTLALSVFTIIELNFKFSAKNFIN